MKKQIIVLLCSAGALLLAAGCSSIKPLPKAYLEKDHELAVGVSRIQPKPTMRDSGQGGLIGVIVNAGRANTMRDKLAGIQGETLKELLRQELTKALGKSFVVVEDAKDLNLDVRVTLWGWFVPSTVLGIKTGAYQCEIMGEVRVLDKKQKDAVVAKLPLRVQKPLGNKPDQNVAQQALLEASQEFAAQVAQFLIQRKTPEGRVLPEK